MASINKTVRIRTHEGGTAKHISSIHELRRSVMACMLWEKQFYEDGETIADRIKTLVGNIPDNDAIKDLAIEARVKMHLRHVPLLIARELARKGYKVKDLLFHIIQRPDEMTEFLAIYWADGKTPISKQIKLGLSRAFCKFNSYQLAKYNRDGAVKLKDVLFMVHAKPQNEEQANTWKKLVDGTLESPDTWEVSLSAGKDKKETFERLIKEGKLGGLALLRNMRNMIESSVEHDIIRSAIGAMKTDKILPFRFIAAAKYAPMFESDIEAAMLSCVSQMEKLDGNTVLLVDVSGSMIDQISQKSDLQRLDAACGLAIILREICLQCRIFTFSNNLVEVPGRHGFALSDAIVHSQNHGGTECGAAVMTINGHVKYDRLIVITDEQSHDSIPDPHGMGYVINVASYQNGIGYGSWIHVDGWSEAIVNYITEYECQQY